MALEVADELDIDIELMAYPTRNYQGTERQNDAAAKKLTKYYQKFGFVPTSEYSRTMIRVAQQNLAQLDSQEEQDTQDMGGKVKAQGIEATIQFDTKSVDGRRRYWTVRRKFTDEKHVKNFINYIEKRRATRSTRDGITRRHQRPTLM